MADQALTEALVALTSPSVDPADFYQPFVDLFPVTGAAVSTVGDLLGSETVSASDALAERIDELQFDLGEGPCWDAMNLAQPVLEPNLRTRPRHAWPGFSAAILEHDVSSLFAFPLRVGPLRIGAVDLYSRDATDLNADQTGQAEVMAGVVGREVLRRALNALGGEFEDVGNASSRRLIHQATGMVLAQLRISADDARLIIQGHSFATGQPMMQVAQDIVDRRLNFSQEPSGIETTE